MLLTNSIKYIIQKVILNECRDNYCISINYSINNY